MQTHTDVGRRVPPNPLSIRPARKAHAKKKKIKTETNSVPRRSDLPNSDVGLNLATLGGRLAEARLKRGFSQETLGDMIDRTRITINSYEKGKFEPGISMLDHLAKALGVSPAYLAFGMHGVQTGEALNASNIGIIQNIVNIDEVTYKDGKPAVSGVLAITKDHADRLVRDARSLRCYVIDHNAEAFALHAGDRVITDSSVTEFVNRHDTYLIELNGDIEIVSAAPSLSGTTLSVKGPRGDVQEIKPASLKIVGAVVSTMHNKS